MDYQHIPVMLPEVIDYLEARPGGKYIDCTLGGSGYTLAIAKMIGPTGKMLAIDLDENALENGRRLITEERQKGISLPEIELVKGNFKNIKEFAAVIFGAEQQVDGIVLDLGLSSFQLSDEERGFSFKSSGPLDMAFGSDGQRSTAQIVNEYSLLELTRIFREYGEEKRAYQLAKAIVAARRVQPIKTAAQLADLIAAQVPARFRGKIHPATRVFQALRLETNAELESLEEVLPAAVELLVPTGRLVVVSFHSGEDRIVKRFFKNRADLEILTKRPIPVSAQEAAENPRARSAKLRAAAKK